ncbi:MAG TPA: HipA family kinase [Candidatus Angelobacter sp.]
MTTSLQAVQHIRRMRGGAQSHLMRGSDNGYWIVKFTNNPQSVRVLANEFFASRIGSFLGLPMPQVAAIEVSDWLITHTLELRIESAGLSVPCESGVQLASRYVADPERECVFDYLPESLSKKINNIEEFSA